MTWHPVPPGPRPTGQAWYPLLGQWGPARFDDIPDDAFVFDDGDLDLALFGHLLATPIAPDAWVTREGKVIQIRDLELSHLRNIIRMIERGILAARERTGKGPRTLAERAESDERVRNLLNEWLRRF